jgi:hypothetical protein
MPVVPFDHAGIGMAEILRDDHQRHAVHDSVRFLVRSDNFEVPEGTPRARHLERFLKQVAEVEAKYIEEQSTD